MSQRAGGFLIVAIAAGLLLLGYLEEQAPMCGAAVTQRDCP